MFSKDLKIAKEEFIKFHNVILENKENNRFKYYEFKLKDNEVIQIICEKFKINDVKEILKRNKKDRDYLLAECKKIKGVTNTQLARIIGVNRKIIDRAI